MKIPRASLSDILERQGDFPHMPRLAHEMRLLHKDVNLDEPIEEINVPIMITGGYPCYFISFP